MKMNRRPKIVVIGGGTGMPVVLRGLKNLPLDITSIVTVADDGGSTGAIRQNVDIPAPGDVRNVIAAMATVDSHLNDLFQYRFQGMDGLNGHSLGNLALVAMSNMTGDFAVAIDKLADIFQVKGRIYPIVNESITLHAETADGKVISGESHITEKEHEKIERVYVTPTDIEAYPQALGAIEEADLLIIAPGSLYTSILPNLIVSGVSEAIQQSTAKTMYICNLMTQHGETDGYDVADHIQAIHSHMDAAIIDTVLVHNQPYAEEVLQYYKAEFAEPVQVNKDKLKTLDISVIEKNLLVQDHTLIRHDEEKIAHLIQVYLEQLIGDKVAK